MVIMFSLLARLRAIAFTILLLLSFSYARDESLFTSSVTYCNPPETLLVQQFDVAYIAKNQSVSFDIIAASVEANVNVTANLLLNVYGMDLVNITIDLCSILGGALCPLPQYNFNGSDSLTVPDSFSSHVPGIAFKIPDLEAFAQLTLTEVGTGDIKACVQATLSNGWSTHQRAVEWSVGIVALIALLLALWQSRSPHALGPYRLLDLMGLYQIIAASALWNLNYPSVYRSFALNFAWALTLFSSPTSQVQQAINNMRALTGGSLANSTSSSAVGFVNRKLSPFNSNTVVSSGGSSSLSSESFSGFSALSNLAKLPSQPLSDFRQFTASTGEVQTVTEASSNVLQAGLPIYVNSINIATANAFMTVFICTLILLAIFGFLVGLGYVGLYLMNRQQSFNRNLQLERSSFFSYVRAWSLRLGMIMFFPILIFAFYQWTLKDSWLSILFSVVAFLGVLCVVWYPIILVVRVIRRSGSSALYSDAEVVEWSAPLYWQYRTERYYFFAIMLAATFLRALFISAARSSGIVQLVLTLVVEIAIFVGLLVLKPHKTRGADVFSTYLAIIRVVCTGLMFAFVESFQVQAIPRVAIGIVIAVIFSITILVVIFNLVLHSGLDRFWKRDISSRSPSRQESADTMLEKGDRTFVHTQSDTASAYGRANNPTPDRNIPLDPSINKPYSPTTPTTFENGSSHDRDSASTNFGTVLPRRWSFTPLHTPTDSSVLDHTTLSHTNTVLSTTPEEHPAELERR
ncbi:TRP-domain-containing protein [Dendrothele bispora CBS 962.96]|uniref:TRP-domain-containing protein n=1 Tax=Dendrothele bispora (strain CBS 962.96) TaxID=1314807 RepID=A0A4S8LFB2_DENBC|nr:TRP-domain-containing protein [Dendrothele bispora CBS 962.96]THV06819.1 TRP-domain-containing protein [Dendrothele bispora CBS 962.96]